MKKQLCTIAFSIVSTFLLSQVNLSSSLTACYSLDGNAVDAINSLNGTIGTITPTFDKNNNPNSAYDFNGTTSAYIELPSSPLLKPTNGLSFSVWVKFKSFQADDHILFTKNSQSSSFAAYDLITYFSGSAYRFRTYKEGAGFSSYAESTTTLTTNTWYHVVLTQDMNAIKIYVNGVLENTTINTKAFDYTPGKNVILGNTRELSYNTPLNGVLDNVRFYNRVINASEVSALFQNPICGEKITSLVIFEKDKTSTAKIIPNPNNGQFSIDLDNNGTAEVVITDAMGRVVLSKQIADDEIITLDEAPAGIYTVRVYNSGNVSSLKFIRY